MIFILFNCSVTDEGAETATNSAPISKLSKLSEEENKECELWRSYQYDYFKNSDKIDTPKAIVANTVKGKGFSFSENNNDWHHAVLTKSLYEKAINELLKK